jgi:hypothetical protein
LQWSVWDKEIVRKIATEYQLAETDVEAKDERVASFIDVWHMDDRARQDRGASYGLPVQGPGEPRPYGSKRLGRVAVVCRVMYCPAVGHEDCRRVRVAEVGRASDDLI